MSGGADQTGGEARRRGVDRRQLIDLTRAERGEPERRVLPGVERRGPGDDVPVPELESDQDVPPRPEEDVADAGEDR